MYRILASLTLFVFLGSLGAAAAQAEPFSLKEKNDRTIVVSDGEKQVLAYNFGETVCKKLKKTDHRRTRGCYIHPLWDLEGKEVLTDDYPRDHRHHHGIFWTWPHVVIDGEHYNLWIDDGKINDKFVRWIKKEATEDGAVLAVENGWFVDDKKVMKEEVKIKVHPATEDGRPIDLDLTFTPIDKPITLRGADRKSYGGLTVRFLVKPVTKSEIRTVKGLTKKDLPDTRLEWVDLMRKPTEDGKITGGGAAVFISPDHPDYPPTWLTRHYGPLCVGYPGVNEKTFEPGTPFTLSYRIFVHDKTFEAEKLGELYDAYKKEVSQK
ncbi:MAG: PmoA family protein [Planctomycetia bacterium]|jgi:hypothetical protein